VHSPHAAPRVTGQSHREWDSGRVSRDEQPTQIGTDAEQLEEVRRDHGASQPFSAVRSDQIDPPFEPSSQYVKAAKLSSVAF